MATIVGGTWDYTYGGYTLVRKPDGVAAGDILIAVLYSVADVIMTPGDSTSWTNIAELNPFNGAGSMVIYGRVAQADETWAYSFQGAQGYFAQSAVIAVSGVPAGLSGIAVPPTFNADASYSSSNVVAPVTPGNGEVAQAGDIALACWGTYSSDKINIPSGTTLVNAPAGAGVNVGVTVVSSGPLGGGTTAGPFTGTISGSDAYIGATILIRSFGSYQAPLATASNAPVVPVTNNTSLPALATMDWDSNTMYPWSGILPTPPQYSGYDEINLVGFFPQAANEWVGVYLIPISYLNSTEPTGYNSTLGYVPNDYYIAWRKVSADSTGVVTLGTPYYFRLSTTAPASPNAEVPWTFSMLKDGTILLSSITMNPISFSYCLGKLDFTANTVSFGAEVTPNLGVYSSGQPIGSYLRAQLVESDAVLLYTGYNWTISSASVAYTHLYFGTLTPSTGVVNTPVDCGYFYENQASSGTVNHSTYVVWYNHFGLVEVNDQQAGQAGTSTVYLVEAAPFSATVIPTPTAFYESGSDLRTVGVTADSDTTGMTANGSAYVLSGTSISAVDRAQTYGQTVAPLMPESDSGIGGATVFIPNTAGVASFFGGRLDATGTATAFAEYVYAHDSTNALTVYVKRVNTWPLGTLTSHTIDAAQSDPNGNTLIGFRGTTVPTNYPKYLFVSPNLQAVAQPQWRIGGLILGVVVATATATLFVQAIYNGVKSSIVEAYTITTG
jgi:hypothetical protein